MFVVAMLITIIYPILQILFGAHTKEELDLYNKVCQFRELQGLKVIQLSDSLSYIGKLHCLNLYQFYDFNENDCSMHSWYYEKGKSWSAGCYLKNEEVMYSKPKEILGINKDGFEIAHTHGHKNSPCNSECCFQSWLNSPGHKEQLLLPYKKMGVSIYNNYATIWFTY
jgi:hypothetical protein